MQNLNLAIVGHVDHGKSTLIGRLLYDTKSLPKDILDEIDLEIQRTNDKANWAYIMDALQEEREQDITIDTTQKIFKTKKRQYTIIDTPGHEEFIKNMITGSTHADVGILIVDVVQGVQEQTKRHMQILSWLGIKQIIVAVNKMDLVNNSKEKFETTKKQLNNYLSKINIKSIIVLPISAQKGDNIIKNKKQNWYSGPCLIESLDILSLPDYKKQNLRIVVQDVYEFLKPNIVAVKVESGSIKTNDELAILPDKKTITIKKIEKFNQKTSKASKGECVGLVLKEKCIVKRGDIFTSLKHLPKISNRFKCRIFNFAERELRKDEKLKIKLATQQVNCKIDKIIKIIDLDSLKLEKKIIFSQNAIKLNQLAEVEIIAEKNLVYENYNNHSALGRFVLLKENSVIAGGIVN